VFLSSELCVRCHWSSTLVSFLCVNARSLEVALKAPYMYRKAYRLFCCEVAPVRYLCLGLVRVLRFISVSMLHSMFVEVDILCLWFVGFIILGNYIRRAL